MRFVLFSPLFLFDSRLDSSLLTDTILDYAAVTNTYHCIVGPPFVSRFSSACRITKVVEQSTCRDIDIL